MQNGIIISSINQKQKRKKQEKKIKKINRKRIYKIMELNNNYLIKLIN